MPARCNGIIESGCLEKLKVDVSAWAGRVLGTAPLEEEG